MRAGTEGVLGEAIMVGAVDAAGRPTRVLPLKLLLQLSIYWFGLSSIFAGLDAIVLPAMIEPLSPTTVATVVAAITTLGAILAILVQPTVGSISDYTITRWGRRKPYLVIGATLDVVFLIGIGTSNTILAIGGFYLALQFSSNFAQGPFQGYMPDLVPAPQVGLASALVGVMQVLGNLFGFAVATVGLLTGDFLLPLVVLGGFELTTALVTVFTVPDGRVPRDRAGRSWGRIAFETWGREVLRYHSFLWLVASRLMILAGIAMLLRMVHYYMVRSLGLSAEEEVLWANVTTVLILGGILVSTVPAARISDRVGRKPPIYAACLIGAGGMALVAIAPVPPVAVAGGFLIGIAAGAFLAVDWALMTDIIPKAAAGKFMGLSNVATGLAGVLAVVVGGLIVDGFLAAGLASSGPRVAYGVSVLFFGIGALCLRPVDPTRVEDEPGSMLPALETG
jgi:MFS family permease